MKKLRKYHKWPSLIAGFFLMLFSISGIVLNHREALSGLQFPRFLMPPQYAVKQWNLGMIKGNTELSNGKQLIYGNAGIWETDSAFSYFRDFNNGLGKGSDQRKIFTLIETKENTLFAGTLFGLYRYDKTRKCWQNIKLPQHSSRVVKLSEYNGKVYVMTRDHLYSFPAESNEIIFTQNDPGVPSGYDFKASLFTTLWVIHSGELLGSFGKLMVDSIGLLVIFFVISGYFYTFLPVAGKRIRLKIKLRLQKLNRSSIKWHTKAGLYTIVFLVVTTISGMFLRPPLLIPVAGSRVAPIPGTKMAGTNIWFDKLRDFTFDTVNHKLLISTSEGFYESKADGSECVPMHYQPPVSVMGITSFEPSGHQSFYVSSFSGVFEWNPGRGTVYDLITGTPAQMSSGGNPFGEVAATGIIYNKTRPVAIIDYTAGWMPIKSVVPVPEMPRQISSMPLSFWSVALEVHTGRIFSGIIGDFYILYVPLMGLTTLTILITGFVMWYKSRKQKMSRQSIKQKCHDNYEIARGA